MNDYLICNDEVVKIGGFSRSHWFDVQNPRSPRFDPTVPAKIYISQRVVRYWRREIVLWLESKRKVNGNAR
jgi:prophage regulatory protein